MTRAMRVRTLPSDSQRQLSSVLHPDRKHCPKPRNEPGRSKAVVRLVRENKVNATGDIGSWPGHYDHVPRPRDHAGYAKMRCQGMKYDVVFHCEDEAEQRSHYLSGVHLWHGGS